MRSVYIATGVENLPARSQGVPDSQLLRLETGEGVDFATDDQGRRWNPDEQPRRWRCEDGTCGVTLIVLPAGQTLQQAMPYRESYLLNNPEVQRNSAVELYLSRQLHRELSRVPLRLQELRLDLERTQALIEAEQQNLQTIRKNAGLA